MDAFFDILAIFGGFWNLLKIKGFTNQADLKFEFSTSKYINLDGSGQRCRVRFLFGLCYIFSMLFNSQYPPTFTPRSTWVLFVRSQYTSSLNV